MEKAAQYLRMSTEHQQYSLEIQATRVAAFAVREGYEIVKTYADAGKSGLTATRREGLKSLIRDVLDGPEYSTVLVLDVSRWGRFQDPDEAGHFEFLCRSAGVQVRYCAEAFDHDDTATAIIMKSIKRAMAADYSRQLSLTTKQAQRQRLEEGVWIYGKSAYGFARQAYNADGTPGRVLAPGQRRPRADQYAKLIHSTTGEAAVVRLIFAWFVDEKMPMAAIAARLNAQGTPYRNPGPWNSERVRCVLGTELVTGVLVYNKYCSTLGSRPRLAEPTAWKRRVVVEPIVSRAVFNAAQKRLRPAPPRYTADELLGRLNALLVRHGYLTGSLINQSADMPSADTYRRRFGTLGKAFAKVGFTGYRSNPPLTAGRMEEERERILIGLRRILDREGCINASLIAAEPGLPARNTIRRRFGSFLAAYALVGYRRPQHADLAERWEAWNEKRRSGEAPGPRPGPSSAKPRPR